MSRFRPYNSDYDRYPNHHNQTPNNHNHDYEIHHNHYRKREETPATTPAIEYQDDFSPFNSEEETYLDNMKPPNSHNFLSAKPETVRPSTKTNKPEKSNEDNYHYHYKSSRNTREIQVQTAPPKVEKLEQKPPDETAQRIGRLETMFEEFIKRSQALPFPSTSKEPQVNKLTVDKNTLEPRNRGFTTSKWINYIQDKSIANNWTEKHILKYMPTKMTGLVKAWYNHLSSRSFTWPEWKLLITKVFPDNIDFVTTLKRLVTRVKLSDETMATYYFSKMYLLEACKISGEDAVSCLIDGLNNSGIQEDAKCHNFQTPEQLYSNFLLNLPDYTVDYLPVITPAVDDNNFQAEDNVGSFEEEQQGPNEEEENFEYGKRDRSRSSEQDSVSRKRTVHSRLDKRFIRSDRPYPASQEKVCKICQKRGHPTKFCRRLQSSYSCSIKDHHSSYLKHCFVVGKKGNREMYKVPALIDTGSKPSLVRKSLIKECRLEDDVVPSQEVIEGLGNENILTLGKLVLTLQVDANIAKVEVLIVSDEVLGQPLLLGENFLTRENTKVTIKGKRVTIEDFNPDNLITNYFNLK